MRLVAWGSSGAYLASVGISAQLCGKLDPSYNAIIDTHVASALLSFNHNLGTGAGLPLNEVSQHPKRHEVFLDQASLRPHVDTASLVTKAKAVCLSGRSQGLVECSPREQFQMEPAVFITELGQRLRVADALDAEGKEPSDIMVSEAGWHGGLMWLA